MIIPICLIFGYLLMSALGNFFAQREVQYARAHPELGLIPDHFIWTARLFPIFYLVNFVTSTVLVLCVFYHRGLESLDKLSNTNWVGMLIMVIGSIFQALYVATILYFLHDGGYLGF